MRPALPRDLSSSAMNEADDNSDDDRQDGSTGYGDIYLKAGMDEDWLILKKYFFFKLRFMRKEVFILLHALQNFEF